MGSLRTEQALTLNGVGAFFMPMGMVKMIKPTLKTSDRTIAAIRPKQVDPYYQSSEWIKLREQVLIRDGYRCTARGCRAWAKVVDHIVSRRNGGSDELGNLRSLCRMHDNRIKEDASGARRSDGRME